MPAYFDKVKKTWYVKFWYKDYTGKRRQTTKRGFKLKKDALKYEHDFIEEQKGSDNITIDKLIERYLLHKKKTIRKSSYDTAKTQIKLYIVPFFKGSKLNDITVKRIMDWHDNFLKEKNLADTTLKLVNGRLSSLFNFAKKYYHIRYNPVTESESIGSLKRKTAYQIWTIEELNKFCSSFDPKSFDALIYKIIYFTGMRPCEITGLSIHDIDLQKGVIHITKSYHYDPEVDGELYHGYLTPPKNDYSIRTIAIPEFLLAELSEYIAYCKKSGISKRIFPTNNKTILRKLRRHIKMSGVKEIRTYDLRHSHASLLIANHQDITLVSKRMGHSSPETTLKIYTHEYGNNTNEMLSFLNLAGEKMEPEKKERK